MQLHPGEGVAQHQLHALGHVALARERLLSVVTEVGTLKQPPNDLAQGKHAGDGAVLEPADEEALHVWFPAAHQPLGKGVGISRRGHPAAMQSSACRVPRHDFYLVAAGGFAQVDPFAYFEGMVVVSPRHVETSFAEPR